MFPLHGVTLDSGCSTLLGAKFGDMWFMYITCDFHVEAMRAVRLVFGTVATKQEEKQVMV